MGREKRLDVMWNIADDKFTFSLTVDVCANMTTNSDYDDHMPLLCKFLTYVDWTHMRLILIPVPRSHSPLHILSHKHRKTAWKGDILVASWNLTCNHQLIISQVARV